MALDAAFLRFVCNEINERAAGAKVDKIQQPERDEFVFILRSFGDTLRLRISASSANPALYFTARSKENPKQAPAMCMLLRKLFTGGRLVIAEQIGFERVVRLRFDCANEMGDRVERCVVAEIMGRNSNIIFTDGNGRIIEAVKRIGGDPDAKRQIIAGLAYTMPPAQDKSDPHTVTREQLANALKCSEENLSDALLHLLGGFSPIVCRELAFRAVGDTDTPAACAPTDSVYAALHELLSQADGSSEPTAVIRKDTGEAMDFSFFRPAFYGEAVDYVRYESPSELLDDFYCGRDKAERMKQRTLELSRLVSRSIERVARRNTAQERELADCANADELRICGELITANLYRIAANSSFAVVENFYDGNAQKKIPLDNSVSPQRNAQKYFKEYKKSVTRKNKLTEQLEKGIDELEWLRSVADEISEAECEADISRIREELAAEGYIKLVSRGKRPERTKEHAFESMVTSDGFRIYYGKNNLQNDELTMRFASNSDIWFHARETFGAHVILRTEGKTPSAEAVFEAAKLAASRSKAASGGKVPVDYTEVRNVRKPKGARPGKVIYVNFKTVIV